MRFSSIALLSSSCVGLCFARTNTSSAPPYSPTNAPMFQLSSDGEFAFYLSEAMALANTGAAASGEILRIATGIVPGDFESFYYSFYQMAQAIHAQATAAEHAEDYVGAREAYFRAASYYRGADFFLHGNWSDPRIDSLWTQNLDSWNRANALLEIPGKRFSVKAHSPNVPHGGNFETIGIFFKASKGEEKKPTVIITTGYDGSQEEAYHGFGSELVKRGINVVVIEGPGQPTVRRNQNLGFIPDWWNVVTPVIDYISNRSDVDMSKLALYGASFGGTLAPIAASRDHRIKSVLAIDGLYSIEQAVDEVLPSSILKLFNSGNATAFNEVFNTLRTDPSSDSETRWFIDQGLWSFNTHDPFEWYTRLGNITMNAQVVKGLTQPVFVAKGQDDMLSRNEPEIAYEKLKTGRVNGEALTYFHQFDTSLGAGEHCSIGAESQLATVVAGWLRKIWEHDG